MLLLPSVTVSLVALTVSPVPVNVAVPPVPSVRLFVLPASERLALLPAVTTFPVDVVSKVLPLRLVVEAAALGPTTVTVVLLVASAEISATPAACVAPDCVVTEFGWLKVVWVVVGFRLMSTSLESSTPVLDTVAFARLVVPAPTGHPGLVPKYTRVRSFRSGV